MRGAFCGTIAHTATPRLKHLIVGVKALGAVTSLLLQNRTRTAEIHTRRVATGRSTNGRYSQQAHCQARAERHNRLVATRRPVYGRDSQQAQCHQAIRQGQKGTTGSLPPGDPSMAEIHTRLSATKPSGKGREAQPARCTRPSGTGREAQQAHCHQAIRQGQRHNRRIAMRRSGTGREAQHTVCHQAEGQRHLHNLRSADLAPRVCRVSCLCNVPCLSHVGYQCEGGSRRMTQSVSEFLYNAQPENPKNT